MIFSVYNTLKNRAGQRPALKKKANDSYCSKSLTFPEGAKKETSFLEKGLHNQNVALEEDKFLFSESLRIPAPELPLIPFFESPGVPRAPILIRVGSLGIHRVPIISFLESLGIPRAPVVLFLESLGP